MRNLKRALSFALACVMLVGMMVVGTSAAFADDADIVNTEAAEMLVALNIVNGKPGNKFDPTGLVTRGEMAKMICVALNGGKDPALTEGGMYPDTKNHWARGYIDYCTNLGIVAGDTAGNFNPDKTVTGTEAAKMILIALGFNAETEKFVNDANWDKNINVVASMKGLFEDVATLPSAGLTRDDAVQMIWNGLQAEMVKYTMVGIVGGNSVSAAEDILGRTILTYKFKMNETEGTVTDISYNSTKKEYTYELTGDYAEAAGLETIDFVSTKDYTDLFAHNATVLWKAVNGEASVYGIVDESKVVATGLASGFSIEDSKIKVGGKLYKFESGETALTDIEAYAYNVYTASSLGAVKTATPYVNVTLLDVNDNGKADTAVYEPFTVIEITYVGKDTFNGGIKFENVVAYEGMAKGDFAKVTAAANTTGTKVVYEKIDTVLTGKVTATKSGKVQVADAWYTPVSGVAATLGTTYKKMPVVNGYIFDSTVKTTTAVATDYAVLTAAESSLTGLNTKLQGKLLLTDGTTIVVDLDDNYVDAPKAYVGTLVKFEEDDGVYTLTAADAEAFDAAAVGGYTYADDGKSTIGAYTIADDAVVFFKNSSNGKYSVVTGADLKAAAAMTTVHNAYANENDATGFGAIAMAYVEGSLTSTTDTMYGYITDTYVVTKDADNKYVVNVTLWNGEENVTLQTAAVATNSGVVADAQTFAKGAIVAYTLNEKGKINSIASAGGANKAVVAYDGDELMVAGDATRYDLDKDTVYMYINATDKKGVEGGSVVMANRNADDTAYVNNVYLVAEAVTNDVVLLVVDVNNKI